MTYRLFFNDTYIDVKAKSLQQAVRSALKKLGHEVIFERHTILNDKKQKATN